VITTQDTDVTPFGTGAYASRQSYVGGMGIQKATLLLKDKILTAASDITRLQKGRLDIVEGNIVYSNPDPVVVMSLGELATRRLYDITSGEHLTAEASATAHSNAYSFGCCFAEVEVDIPLGKVRLLRLINANDCGRLLNPQLAEAQVHGGMSMGVGYALTEEMKYDEKTGRLLNGNLLDYKLSTTLDHPDFETIFVENWEPTGAYGNKALGEPPTVPGAAAIRNALLNATGVAVNRIPLTPHVLLPAFKEAGLL
jgi:xanthine dehydrogenase molybdenum-binding subunit